MITAPVLGVMIAVRTSVYFVRRVFIAEPLFKVYCTQYGRHLHTGIHVHWVQGKGELFIGDDVSIQGKCSFFFAARYSEKPRLLIGDNTGIGHNCSPGRASLSRRRGASGQDRRQRVGRHRRSDLSRRDNRRRQYRGNGVGSDDRCPGEHDGGGKSGTAGTQSGTQRRNRASSQIVSPGAAC